MCRHSSYDAWDESSDEDDEDDAFMSYIRSQQFAFATSQTKNQQISLMRPKPIRSNSNGIFAFLSALILCKFVSS